MKRIWSVLVASIVGVAICVVMPAPAGAAQVYQEAGVRVSTTAIGDLVITGGADGVRVAIVPGTGPEELGIVIDDIVGGAVDVSVPVSRNVRASLGGGDDELRVEGGVALPGSLNVITGPAGIGGDDIVISDATVSGVVTARFTGAGSLRSANSAFGQTMVVRGGNGNLTVCDGACLGGGGSEFSRNVRVQAGRRGTLDFATSQDSVIGVRLTVIGGANGADLELRGDLGLNPVLRTLRGDDRWLIDGAEWDGKLRGITSVGDDEVLLLAPGGIDPLLFNVNLGGGSDSIVIDQGFDPASRANGTGGIDEACDLTGVLLRTFETVLVEDCL